MTALLRWISLAAALSAPPVAAWAGGGEPCPDEPMDAEAIVAACEAERTPYLASGTTGDMIAGANVLKACLEEALVSHLHRLTSNYVSLEETETRVRTMIEATEDLSSQLWERNNFCRGLCGTQGYVIVATSSLDTLEKMLRLAGVLDHCGE